MNLNKVLHQDGVKMFELIPTRQKSFYHKAIVLETQAGEKYLQSYCTLVCVIDKDGNFKRLWGGESATTIKHVNDFLRLYNIPGGGVHWWRNQEVFEEG